MPSERSQTQKDENCMVSLMWTLKNITKQKQIHLDRELVVTRGGEGAISG